MDGNGFLKSLKLKEEKVEDLVFFQCVLLHLVHICSFDIYYAIGFVYCAIWR